MFYFSPSIGICIIGTVVSIGSIVYVYKFDNIINNKYIDKAVQTELHFEIKKTPILKLNKQIQCDLDILMLEDEGHLQVVGTSSSNYRWFFLKIMGFT